MSASETDYSIPRRLDDPPKFLWWDADVAILAMGCLVLGIVLEQTLPFLLLGIGIALFYQKLKAGRTRAFGLHALYWYTPITFGFTVTPPSAAREFIG
jgi:conjugal transfer pilus assembly protein TraL